MEILNNYSFPYISANKFRFSFRIRKPSLLFKTKITVSAIGGNGIILGKTEGGDDLFNFPSFSFGRGVSDASNDESK